MDGRCGTHGTDVKRILSTFRRSERNNVFYVVNGSFLPYPPDSDTVHLRQDHWCSSQSRAINTVATQNGGSRGRTYYAGIGY